MRGFVDLHCHWIPGIDDGARSPDDGVAMLRGLHRAGFDTVVATPHMRPGMFDNDRRGLEEAFARMAARLASEEALGPVGLPGVQLASEHFLDDVVFARLVRGEGLPYPRLSGDPGARAGRRGVLIELPPQGFPAQLARRLFDLGRAGLRPVLAHPERYQPVWKDDRCLDALIDAGASLLLDVCALAGKYGRASQRAAEKLLDDEAYEAACSDAHRPADTEVVAEAIARLEDRVGRPEAERLLREGPLGILAG